MKYPEILGRRITLLPAKYRTAEWFEALPQEIRRQFYWTIQRFNLQVASEYLRDNHGCDDTQSWKPTKKRGSEFGDVRGSIYANNTFKFFFPDGPQYFCIKNNPAQWCFVGYVDVGGKRIVRTSRDSSYVRTKLALVIKNAIASGISRMGISDPMIFNLTLTVAENIQEVAA